MFKLDSSKHPPEVGDCLKETIGVELLQKIETGESFTPSPDIGEKMRGCFNDFSGPGGGLGQIFQDAPPPVLTCIESRLGTGVIEEVEAGNFSRFGPESEQIIGGCFREFGGFGGPGGSEFEGTPGFEGDHEDGYDPFEEAPPVVLGCLSTELGFTRYSELRDAGAEPTPADLEALKRCFAQSGFAVPAGLDEGDFDGGFDRDGSFDRGFDSGFTPQTGGIIPDLSPPVTVCLFGKLGADFKERLFSGQLDRAVIDQTIRLCTEEQFLLPPPDTPLPPEEGGEIILPVEFPAVPIDSIAPVEPENQFDATFDGSTVPVEETRTDDSSTPSDGSIDDTAPDGGTDTRDQEIQSSGEVHTMLGNARDAFIGLFK